MLQNIRAVLSASVFALAGRISIDPRFPAQSRLPAQGRAVAGVRVTPDTAVQIPAVWACLTYISESVAVLPWHVHEETDDGNKMLRSHPVDWLLYKRPNPEWSSFQFRETLLHWALRYGNGYAEIERDQAGRPFALWPIHPDRVSPCRDGATGELYYEINNGSGSKVEIDAADMFHIRGFGEGVVGVNVIEYAAESLGWARAAHLFGASFFGNGATPSVVVKNKKALSPAALKRQRREFEALYKGPMRANKTAHLDNDSDIEVVGLDAEKSQIIAVHQFLVTEICRIFRVPPHIVAELTRSTNNNIEQQAIEAVQRCLMPWVKRFEDEADAKLFGANRRALYSKMNLLALLRGDAKSQAESFQIYRNMGVMNADEIRERVEMNKIGKARGGDKYLVNGASTPLDAAGSQLAQPTTPAVEPPQKLLPPPDNTALDEERPLDAAGQAAMEQFWRIVNGASEHV